MQPEHSPQPLFEGQPFVHEDHLKLIEYRWDYLSDGQSLDSLNGRLDSCVRLASEVVLQELKILPITDLSIVVSVNFSEQNGQLLWSGLDFNEGQGIVESIDELIHVHHFLSSPLIQIFLMQPLDGELPAMGL